MLHKLRISLKMESKDKRKKEHLCPVCLQCSVRGMVPILSRVVRGAAALQYLQYLHYLPSIHGGYLLAVAEQSFLRREMFGGRHGGWRQRGWPQ